MPERTASAEPPTIHCDRQGNSQGAFGTGDGAISPLRADGAANARYSRGMSRRLVRNIALALGIFVILRVMNIHGIPFAARMIVPVAVALAILTWERRRGGPG